MYFGIAQAVLAERLVGAPVVLLELSRDAAEIVQPEDHLVAVLRLGDRFAIERGRFVAQFCRPIERTAFEARDAVRILYE